MKQRPVAHTRTNKSKAFLRELRVSKSTMMWIECVHETHHLISTSENDSMASQSEITYKGRVLMQIGLAVADNLNRAWKRPHAYV